MDALNMTVLKDCLHELDPFCKLALSLTCKDYNHAFKNQLQQLIHFISNYSYYPWEVKWVYHVFGTPCRTLFNIIAAKVHPIIHATNRIKIRSYPVIYADIMTAHMTTNTNMHYDYSAIEDKKEWMLHNAKQLLVRVNKTHNLYALWINQAEVVNAFYAI